MDTNLHRGVLRELAQQYTPEFLRSRLANIAQDKKYDSPQLCSLAIGPNKGCLEGITRQIVKIPQHKDLIEDYFRAFPKGKGICQMVALHYDRPTLARTLECVGWALYHSGTDGPALDVSIGLAVLNNIDEQTFRTITQSYVQLIRVSTEPELFVKLWSTYWNLSTSREIAAKLSENQIPQLFRGSAEYLFTRKLEPMRLRSRILEQVELLNEIKLFETK